MRISLENCTCLNIGTLQKSYKKKIFQEYPDKPSEEDLYEILNRELKNFSVGEQHFEYTSIKAKMGGFRWFFLCPKCRERVTKLFLPPSDAPYEKKYLCKACHNIKNQSAIMGQSRLYKQVTRPLKRLRDIEKKLENSYLGTEKIKALLDEYETIENQMKNTPEYRLYMFRRSRK